MTPEVKKDKKRQFAAMLHKLLPVYRLYEDSKYNEGVEESWEHISRQINTIERRSLRAKIYYPISIAASVLLLVGGLSIWLGGDNKVVDESIELQAQRIVSPENPGKEILLVTSDQQKLNIDDNANVKYAHDGSVTVDSRKVEQTVSSGKKAEPVYNQIIVPKGKRTHVYFADGTRIYVNSGSRVVYPSVFADDKREIYVDGEIYLDVKRDESRPFYVKSRGMNVRVLGTSFSVCSYEEDEESSVVLVSGKVEVETHAKEKMTLAPDEMFSMKSSGISKRKVDASEYVCWVNDMMIFKKEPLTNVLTRLSRYYGQEMKYSQELGKLTVSGKLDLRDNLEDVLKIISSFAPLKYKMVNDTLTVIPDS